MELDKLFSLVVCFQRKWRRDRGLVNAADGRSEAEELLCTAGLLLSSFIVS